jgi:opacity protein-like surface antigen
MDGRPSILGIAVSGRNYSKGVVMNRKIFFLIALVTMLVAVSDAEAKKGFFLGLGTAYNTIQGDFNGSKGLSNGSDVIIVPDIDNAFGFDIQFGYGFTDAWAIELNLMGSTHSGTSGGFSGDVDYFSFSINGKYSFATSTSTQPYLLFGISGNSLVIEKGARNTFTGQVDDATLSGPGFNAGVGVDQYLSPNVSLNMGLLYRYVDYTDAEGVDNSGDIDDGLDGSGFSFLLTAVYHF